MFGEGPLRQARPPRFWGVIGSLPVVALFLFVAISLWIRPDWTRQPPPDWKPVFALAEAARDKANFYEAKHLYLEAGVFASWGGDLEGILAAACGIKKIESMRGNYFSTTTILIRAMSVAEGKQSRLGIAAVARAFSAIGKQNAANMVLSKIRPEWPESSEESLHDVDLWDCRAS